MSQGLVPIDVSLSGGSATTSMSAASDNAQTISFNPALQVGGGTQYAEPTANASATSPQDQAPLFSPYPAGAGYATVGYAYPGSASAPINVSPALQSLFSNPLVLLMLAGLVLVVIADPGGGGRRR